MWVRKRIRKKFGFVLKLRDEVNFIANKYGSPIYSYAVNNKGGNPYERDHYRPAP